MTLPPLYSRRKRLQEKTSPDVFQYSEISDKLANQILIIFNSVIDSGRMNLSRFTFYNLIEKMLLEEMGVVGIAHGQLPEERFASWFRKTNIRYERFDHVMDAIEFGCNILVHYYQSYEDGPDIKDNIAELNARMMEDGFGFQFENGMLIQISSTFVHKEITVPALNILSVSSFSTANSEFRQAHSEYRAGNYAGCLVECCKALESVLKVIGDQKNWGLSANATMKVLLDAAFQNNLIPAYLKNQFAGIHATLLGVATVRNKSGGHGAGPIAHNVPKELAEYQLHQTAAAILFLAGLA